MVKRTYGPSTVRATKRTKLGTGPGRTSVRGNYRMRKRVYRPKRRPSTAIAKLAKQVQWNALKLHGAPQTNQQSVTWQTGGSLGDVRDEFPIIFDLSNFTSDNYDGTIPNSICNPVYQMEESSTPSSYDVGLAGFFQRVDFKGLNGLDRTSMWLQPNKDVPDTGKYFAVSSHYRITAACKGETRIRIQIFTVKPSYLGLANSARDFRLPNPFLDGLGRMTGGNQFNRRAFKIYKDVEKVISPANDLTAGNVVFEFSFKHMKLVEQYLTNPAVAPTNPAGALAPNVVSETDASGIFNASTWFNATNIPQAQPFWMLISTNVTGEPNSTNANQCKFSISRTVRWRDPVG